MTPNHALFPKITDEGLDELRQRIDVPIDDTLEPWSHEATRDAIRHYAHGIGDDNPLWCDPDYAARHALRQHRRAAQFPVRDQPDRLGLLLVACRASTRCGRAPTGPGTSRCCATTRSRPRPG